MTVHRLTQRIEFPPVSDADEDGLLAIGGDLRLERLVMAYRLGIYPMPIDVRGGRILTWHAPDPRCVLFPDEVHVSHSLKPMLRRGAFEVTVDRAFREVIHACRAAPRPGQPGTWITPAMVEAYCALHAAGHAHSLELWRDGRLAGGLYGVRTGRVFSGESIFTRVSNAGRYAVVMLARLAPEWGVELIDCQMRTDLLAGLGARFIPRGEFVRRLAQPAAAGAAVSEPRKPAPVSGPAPEPPRGAGPPR